MVPPPKKKTPYNQEFNGVYGEFGSGADLQAVYVQSAVPPEYLDKISLVSDIRGSEKWPIRDLFQRDVDQERITHELYPYLTSVDKIKFFNPLTLTVLPMDVAKREVRTRMPPLSTETLTENDTLWDVLAWGEFFRLRWVRGQEEYAKLEWNDVCSRVVAIDGQHRLSALKRLWTAPNDEGAGLRRWRIPIVIVTFRAAAGRTRTRTVLNAVRNIFVDINTQAHRVSGAREVLLSDGSVNALATQELLQQAHSNDLEDLETRRRRSVPLLFFDWRGKESIRRPVRSAAAVKSVVEVRDWFAEYILGGDLSRDQEAALGIEPTDPLKPFFLAREKDKNVTLDFEGGEHARELLRARVLPAVSHLLEEFSPYRRYIAGLRDLESEYGSGTDLEQLAFEYLRFESRHGIEATAGEVQKVEDRLVEQIAGLKARFLRPPLDHDVGMRGVLSAFGALVWRFGYPDWLEYSKWFTASLNEVHRSGWLELGKRKGKRKHLLHVIENQNETVVNYRLKQADRAFGPFVALLVAACGSPFPAAWRVEDWPSERADLLYQLGETMMSGHRRQQKAELREVMDADQADFEQVVEDRARSATQLQLRKFEEELRKITRSRRT